MSEKKKLSEYLSELKIDKTNPKWRGKAVNADDKIIDAFPDSLPGEILLETVIDDGGKVKGWITISPDRLDEIFIGALEAHKEKGGHLSDMLIVHNDNIVDVDLDADAREEATRIVLAKYGNATDPRILDEILQVKNIIQGEKEKGGKSVSRIKLSEKGYKKYIEEWITKGLIK